MVELAGGGSIVVAIVVVVAVAVVVGFISFNDTIRKHQEFVFSPLCRIILLIDHIIVLWCIFQDIFGYVFAVFFLIS